MVLKRSKSLDGSKVSYLKFLKNPKEHLEKIQQGRMGLDRGDELMKGFHRLLKT